MNEKEAREIIIRGQSIRLEKGEVVTLFDMLKRSITKVQEYAGAEKYLKATKKADILVASLRRIADAYYKKERHEAIIDVFHALAEWEKTK